MQKTAAGLDAPHLQRPERVVLIHGLHGGHRVRESGRGRRREGVCGRRRRRSRGRAQTDGGADGSAVRRGGFAAIEMRVCGMPELKFNKNRS